MGRKDLARENLTRDSAFRHTAAPAGRASAAKARASSNGEFKVGDASHRLVSASLATLANPHAHHTRQSCLASMISHQQAHLGKARWLPLAYSLAQSSISNRMHCWCAGTCQA